MVYGVVVVVHVLICLVLIGVILLQGGRGGLSDALGGAAAQSLFGGGVATVMTRATTICAGLFVVTCLSLAYLSTIKGRSVIEQMQTVAPGNLPVNPLAPFATPEHTEPAGSATPSQPEPSATSGTQTPPSDSSASP